MSVFLLLFLAGIAAGVSNAVAGGGTFFTFPVFLAAGLPPVVANASNAIAVWPGHAMAVPGYRRELSGVTSGLRLTLIVVLTGGVLGAWLLTIIDNATFSKLIPFLILFATLLFAFGRNISTALANRATLNPFCQKLFNRLAAFLFAIYGAFFGGGFGIMLMAWLQMSTTYDIQTNNGLKNLIATVVSTVAVILFSVSGLVSWQHTGVAFAGAVIGGLLGARFARWLPAQALRLVVITVGLLLSGYYFLKYYFLIDYG